MGEGFPLIRRYDVTPDVFLDVMTDGLFACSAYKVYGKIIAEERYQPAGQRAISELKDANFALEAGGAVGVPLPRGKCLAQSPWSARWRMARASTTGR